ncbi:MAG: T9SS type A sorting domain-containing protein [bacterium]|nr:T9SS type A sorting domain-containing protein [bacterium]
MFKKINRKNVRSSGNRVILVAIFIVSLLLYVNVESAPTWSIPITVKGDGTSYTLYFAVDTGATDGYNSGKDEPHPPGPPGAFDAYFYIVHPDFPCLTKDARAPASNSWTLVTANAIGKTDSITWSLANISNEGTFTLNGINMSVESVAVYEGNITKTITYTDTTPPSAPTNISVSRTGGGTQSILTWTNPAQLDFAHIRIYRSTTLGQLGSLVHDNVTGTTKTDTGLTSGVTYWYTLRSVDLSSNESKNTDQHSASIPIVVKGDGTSYTLYFGTDPNATNSYDSGIDEPHPPGPPGAFDSYFYIVHPDFPCLTKDMRSVSDTLIIWTLVTTNAIGKTDSIKWSPSNLPTEGTFTFDTTTLKLNMRTDSVAMYIGNQTLYIRYRLTSTQYTVSGKVGLSNNPSDSSGSIVVATGADTALDITDRHGAYSLNVKGGTYKINVTHTDYYSKDTTVVISSNTAINLTLTRILKDVGAVAIVAPPDTVYTDSTVNVVAKVANFGNTGVSFNVYCDIHTIYQSVYADTQGVVDLSPGDTVKVSFRSWCVPSAAGGTTFTMDVKTLLVSDVAASNDTTSKKIFVQSYRVEEVGYSIPTTYLLLQSVPNPATGAVRIHYAIPEKSRVKIKVYDITGKIVTTIKDGVEESGYKVAVWDMKDAKGEKVQFGVYFYRLEIGGLTFNKKMVILK